MIVLMQCVAEAVVARGVRGLAELVPGGPYLFDVADEALRRLRARRRQDQLADEIREAAAASFEEARAAAGRVARGVAEGVPPADLPALELYLAQIPAAVRRSLRRADDPAGRTVPPGLSLASADDLLRRLPPQMPRHRPGDLLPGRPGWVLREPLGAGGFGEVWLARHDFIPDARAVKFCTDPTARQRLLAHEGKLVARVMAEGKHPHVVPLADAHLEGDAPWLAYEYVGGGDLTALALGWQHLPTAGRAARAAAALRTLAATVGHFHRLTPPIVHRDLKPSNILVAADGSLRVTDFGIGGLAVGGLPSGSRDGPTGYTRAASLLAGAYTPLYASPQQQRGEKPDPRDDVHALGVITYQMLTGRLDQAPGPRFDRDLLAAGAPRGLVELIGDCVDPDPARRPADGAAVAARLARLSAAELTDDARAEPKPVPKPKPESPAAPNRAAASPAATGGGCMVPLIVGLGLTAALVAFVLILMQKRGDPPAAGSGTKGGAGLPSASAYSGSGAAPQEPVMTKIQVAAPVSPPRTAAERLVGRWQHPFGNGAYMEFFPNGRFKHVALLNSGEGFFRVLNDSEMEWDIPGTLYGRNVSRMAYRFDGDALVMIGTRWVRAR